MMSMDVRHPDIMSFVKVKRNLTQVTGANISVKLTDDFMNDVKNEETHSLQFPVDSDSNVGTIPAKELWDEIIKSAHGVAEPGLLFWDNMVNYSPDGVYPQFKPITTNPCSEIAMQPYDACRLIAVNLLSFVKKPFTKDAYFDHGHFHTVNYEAMVLSDDLIDLELEHIKRILDKIKKDPENVKLKHTEFDLWTNIYNTARSSRRTGLGFTGLGDTLAALGFRYDDPDALTRVEEIMHTKLLSELECTTDLSIHRGHFEGWKASTERKGNAFYEFIEKKFPKQWAKMQRVGRRNVSWSTVAPTGTVSIMTQTTSGIEPLFAGFYTRRKKINPNEKGARVDFVDDNGDSWTEYQILHPQFKEWIRQHKGDYLFDGSEDAATKEELQEWFDQSPWYGSTAADINWDMRLQMQATIQKYVTHSISSTINLPRDTSEEVVSEIYKNAWSLGIKGITVYRDGSRDGVLLTDSKPKEEDFNYKDAMKRPKTLQCEVHTTMYRGKEFAVIVGLYQNKPYEVFAFENIFDLKSVTGVIKKATRGVYELSVEDKVIMPNITFEMEDEEEALTRMLSTALRHGTDITFVVEQLRKSKGDITAFSKSIARVLTKYTKPREEEEMCPECSSQMIREEGCLNCKACGHSKCG
jgi:ribonucleoside-diphosphate reductase alpha chain